VYYTGMNYYAHYLVTRGCFPLDTLHRPGLLSLFFLFLFLDNSRHVQQTAQSTWMRKWLPWYGMPCSRSSHLRLSDTPRWSCKVAKIKKYRMITVLSDLTVQYVLRERTTAYLETLACTPNELPCNRNQLL